MPSSTASQQSLQFVPRHYLASKASPGIDGAPSGISVGVDVPGNIDATESFPEGANGIGCWLVLHDHAYPKGIPTGECHREDAIKLSIDVRNFSHLADEPIREEIVFMGGSSDAVLVNGSA